MKDEGIGIAGWLMADLVLVLAVIFLVLTPGIDAPPPEAEDLTTPTVTPTPTETATPPVGSCLAETDFRFSQIVIEGLSLGSVTWEQIANSPVRKDLDKSQEAAPTSVASLPPTPTALDYLMQRQKDGYRIALVETFAHARGSLEDIKLASEVNDAFFDELDSRSDRPTREIFLMPDEAREKWSADYLNRLTFEPGSARINLYFVRPPDEDCAATTG